MINLFVVNVKSRHIFDIPSDLSLSVFAHGSGYTVYLAVFFFVLVRLLVLLISSWLVFVTTLLQLTWKILGRHILSMANYFHNLGLLALSAE